jgi:serine/threonine-protein kinase HipA
MLRFKQLYIHTTQGYAGELARESQFVFNYRTDDRNSEIALTMPLRAQSYSANTLPGVLRQNLPEGYLHFWIKEHFGKVARMDDMSILALSGRDVIGRVRCHAHPQGDLIHVEGESLKEILTWQGTEDLFDYLAEKYALVSGVSGIQPKVLVPEASAPAGKEMVDKATVRGKNLIVKSSGADYPGLAENEYFCMDIARHAGLEVPAFWLSDNRKLFVVERFDFRDGAYLGFEDMTSLMNRQTDEKYTGSYENVAKAASLFTSPAFTTSSLESLFRSIVLSVLVRNGDAHLKNFGLLYTHPHSDDCRLSPLYDVVNTTIYLPRDTLALKLNGTKSWPSKKDLIAFGKENCRIDYPERIIEQIADTAMEYSPPEACDIWEQIKPKIGGACLGMSKNA